MHNKVVFAAYEVGVSAVSILAQMRADPAWPPEAGRARSGDRHRVCRAHGGGQLAAGHDPGDDGFRSAIAGVR